NDLSCRKQFVHIEDHKSEIKPISRGVIQGNIKSPLYFKSYVQSLPQCVSSSRIFQYCDDTTLVQIIRTEDDAIALQQDLDNVARWSTNMDLSMNPKKSRLIRITTRKNCQILYQYNLNQIPIPQVYSSPLLGVTIDYKLDFSDFCEAKISSATKAWASVKRIVYGVDSLTLLRLYKSYILPIIEYGSN